MGRPKGNLWQPGQSGNPSGAPKTKPFADALRMEIAAAGENHKKLRQLAARLLQICDSEDDRTALAGIQTVFDRLDGKTQTAQELQLESPDGRHMTIRWLTDD